MIFKQGVSIKGLRPEALLAMIVVDEVFKKMGLGEPVCTSCNDSQHMTNSLHYKGLAFDLRSHNLRLAEKLQVYNELRNRLKHLNFDIIQESLGMTNEHIHIEKNEE